jgi:hypothetical protein
MDINSSSYDMDADDTSISRMPTRRQDPPSHDYGRPDSPKPNELAFLETSSSMYYDDDDDDPPYDVEHSLPHVEDLYTDRNRTTNKRSIRCYMVAGICFLALVAIVGFSTGMAVAKRNSQKPSRSTDLSATTSSHKKTASAAPAPTVDEGALRMTELQTLLQTVYRQAGLNATALTEPGSAPYQAMHWLAVTDNRRVDINASSIVQRYVLATMYFGLRGQHWRMASETKWLTEAFECKYV